jgi:small GTP-binding protein
MDSIPILKVVIAGDPNVGKTSLVRSYCEGKFESSRVLTIGVDFQTKVVNLPTGTVKLSIWDMAGQDRFEVVRAGFYRGSLTTALIYDLAEPETLKSLVRWFHEVRRTLPQQKFIVVGNKLDLVSNPNDRIGRELARIIHAPYINTSARTSDGVAALFETLARSSLSCLPSPTQNSG